MRLPHGTRRFGGRSIRARNTLNVSSGNFSLEGFDDPPVEYRGEPVRMRLRLFGEVSQDEPGRLRWTVQQLSPRMINADEQALGSDSAEEALEALRENGVEIPDFDDDEVEVDLTVEVSDEDYGEIVLASDWEHFHSFAGERNEEVSF